MKSKIDLAKKLKELVNRGEGGEKFNAEAKLNILMDKYGITDEDIEETERWQHEFFYKRVYRKIMLQSIAYIMGKKVNIYTHRHYRNGLVVDCTPVEFIEINAVYDFYSNLYQHELDLFTEAFIQRNQLLPPDASSFDWENATPEELERLERMNKMMEGIDKQILRKQLNE